MPENSKEQEEKVKVTPRDIEFMRQACLLCDNSTLEVKTGCLLVKNGVVVGEGWNCEDGSSSFCNHPNCESGHTVFCFNDSVLPRNFSKKGVSISTNSQIVHAEQMAISQVQLKKVDFSNAIVYVTRFPCIDCAKKLVEKGISKLFYMSDHFSSGNEALPIFEKADVLVTQIPEKLVWEKKPAVAKNLIQQSRVLGGTV
jgi:deoxycytidylate deaminase